MSSFLKSVCVASLAALGITTANAATITNSDGTFADFGGFDWNSAASSVTLDPIVDGATVTTVYYADAVQVQDSSGNDIGATNLGTDYEYTIYATFEEQVTCLTRISWRV